MKQMNIDRVVKLIGNFLTVVSLVFLVYVLYENIGKLPPIRLRVVSILSVVVCLAINMWMVVLQSFVWKGCLKQLGGDIRLWNAFSLMAKSQVAKYIPGNVFQYVSRVSLTIPYSITVKQVVGSLILETCIVVLGALSVVASGFLYFKDLQVYSFIQLQIGSYFFLWIILSMILLTGIMFAVLRYKDQFIQVLGRIDFLQAAFHVFVIAVAFIFYGAALKILLLYFLESDTHVSILQLSSGFALAWLVGFLTPGAPGGIGIREALMVMLFGGVMDSALIISLALTYRILNIVSDVSCFGLTLIIREKTNYV